MSNFLAKAQRLSRLRGLLIGYGLLSYALLPLSASSESASASHSLLLVGIGIQLCWFLILWQLPKRAPALAPALRLLLELLADGVSVGLFAYSTLAGLQQQLQAI